MRKFGITAGDDLDNLTQLVGEGATRLRGMIFYVVFVFFLLIYFCFTFAI